jgi:hypothetical protein
MADDSSTRKRLEEALAEIRKAFFIPDDVLADTGPNFDAPKGVVTAASPLNSIASAFYANVGRATGAALIPFVMSHAAAAARHVAIIRNTWELTAAPEGEDDGADAQQGLRHFFRDPENL